MRGAKLKGPLVDEDDDEPGVVVKFRLGLTSRVLLLEPEEAMLEADEVMAALGLG
jgi:hypothetical protein